MKCMHIVGNGINSSREGSPRSEQPSLDTHEMLINWVISGGNKYDSYAWIV